MQLPGLYRNQTQCLCDAISVQLELQKSSDCKMTSQISKAVSVILHCWSPHQVKHIMQAHLLLLQASKLHMLLLTESFFLAMSCKNNRNCDGVQMAPTSNLF
jgi:hypothetical protein